MHQGGNLSGAGARDGRSLRRSEDIRCQAIGAAGSWAIAAAWPHVKPLWLAALEGVLSISPEGEEILNELVDSEDEEISEAAEEALAVGAPMSDDDFEDGDEAAKRLN